MSYVSLENSEPFLKCFEVIAEDKSCIVTDSVLYFSGKTGKGFITVAGVATGIEVLAVNVSMLTDDLTLQFLPSPDADSYILSFEEIEIPGKSGEATLRAYRSIRRSKNEQRFWFFNGKHWWRRFPSRSEI